MRHGSHLRRLGLFCGLMCLVACASETEPDPRQNPLFPFDLKSGQTIVYESPTQTLRIEGPTRVNWDWRDEQLFLSCPAGSARVRPVEVFPPEPMTDEMILRAQAIYTNVPRIDELLAGHAGPTLHEWAAAYSTWLEEIVESEIRIKQQYVTQMTSDVDGLAAEIASQYGTNPLVVPGQVRVVLAVEGSSARDLLVVYRGVPNHPDGTPDEWVVQLRADYQPPPAPSTRYSLDEALALHLAAYTAAESGRPFLLDLSRGERLISGKRGR